MPAPSHIPAELLAAPFTVESARALGLSRRALALLLPDAELSHLTAARLDALPVPGRCGPLGLPVDEDLEVTVCGKAPTIRGVRAHRGLDDADVRVSRAGLRVTTGGRTWADLAPRLTIDDLLHRPHQIVARIGAAIASRTAG